MILDTLAQGHQYTAITPRFAKAFAFLRHVTEGTKPGRYEIDGDDIYAFVQQTVTTPLSDRQYEVHRKYIDIQYVHRGREIMYWAPLALLTIHSTPYDAEADAALFGLTADGVPLPVGPGQFAIFFPEDGHIPSCHWDQPAEVFKVIVKVRV